MADDDGMTDDEAAEAYMAALAELERNPWRERAEAAEARVAELEAALIESNKNTLTPKQQGEIAARALFPLRVVEKGTDLEN